MAKVKKATQRELRFAIAFLRNIHGNSNNGALILAVVAWARTKRLRALLGRYASTDAAARALTRRLRTREYRVVRKVLARSARTAKARAVQAEDFLTELAKTSWDSRHFGFSLAHPAVTFGPDSAPALIYSPNNPLSYDIRRTQLWAIFVGLLNKGFRIPPTIIPAPPPPPPPKPPPPKEPAGRVNRQREPDYLDGYLVLRFIKETRVPLEDMVTGTLKQ